VNFFDADGLAPAKTDSLEKVRQDLDSTDEDQVVERSRVGDDSQLPSQAQSLEGRAFALEIFRRVLRPDLMGLQKTVEDDTSL
jgi:hypothetical protein